VSIFRAFPHRENRIRPPVKVDQNKRVIRSPNGRAHWWRLNVPASRNGGAKLRLFFRTEKEARAHAEGLLEAHLAGQPDLLGQLRLRGPGIRPTSWNGTIELKIRRLGCRSIAKVCQCLGDYHPGPDGVLKQSPAAGLRTRFPQL
jgi:hypothetical protein